MELYGAVLFAELSDVSDLTTTTTEEELSSDSTDATSELSSDSTDATSESDRSCDSATLSFLETGYTEDFISISVLDYDEGETVFILPELI